MEIRLAGQLDEVFPGAAGCEAVGSPLQAWLTERQVTSGLVAGCNLPNCPRATLFDATERDFRAGIVADAVSQAMPVRLADLSLIGVQQVTVDEVLQHLG